MLPQESSDAKAPPARLMVDAMLGRLARWLRLIGYDTLYWREGSDGELAVLARSEERLIITRDRQLASRRGVRALLVHSETLGEQITEVRRALACNPPLLSRCSKCNGELQNLTHEDARELVPPYVWHTQAVFRRCADCGRAYWRGTHWPGMRARLVEDPRCGEGEDMGT